MLDFRVFDSLTIVPGFYVDVDSLLCINDIYFSKRFDNFVINFMWVFFYFFQTVGCEWGSSSRPIAPAQSQEVLSIESISIHK